MALMIDGLSSKERIEKAAISLFLKQGIAATTNKMLAETAQVGNGSLANAYRSKEDLLLICFEYIFPKQTAFFSEIKNDIIHRYCLETAVILYMCDHNEVMKELYSEAYSLPKTMDFIKSQSYKYSKQAFDKHLPSWTEHDFYEAEITKTAIIFGYVMESSNPYFTQEHKTKRCLTSILKLFEYGASEREEIIKQVLDDDIKTYSEQFTACLLDGVTQI